MKKFYSPLSWLASVLMALMFAISGTAQAETITITGFEGTGKTSGPVTVSYSIAQSGTIYFNANEPTLTISVAEGNTLTSIELNGTNVDYFTCAEGTVVASHGFSMLRWNMNDGIKTATFNGGFIVGDPTSIGTITEIIVVINEKSGTGEVDPIAPVDPIDPVDPVDPVDPEDPDEEIINPEDQPLEVTFDFTKGFVSKSKGIVCETTGEYNSTFEGLQVKNGKNLTFKAPNGFNIVGVVLNHVTTYNGGGFWSIGATTGYGDMDDYMTTYTWSGDEQEVVFVQNATPGSVIATANITLAKDDTTAVEAIETSAKQENVYDLSGRRANVQNGAIRIVNGQKRM